MTFVDINNHAQLESLLTKLNAGTTPLWGNMNAQQMVEHLIDQVRYTNGVKIPVDTGLPPDFAEQKQKWIYTSELIPRNVVLGKLSEQYIYDELETAKQQLIAELKTFRQYYKANPGIEVLHGGFGMMNYDEWVIWHGKHFTHHFKQFGITQ